MWVYPRDLTGVAALPKTPPWTRSGIGRSQIISSFLLGRLKLPDAGSRRIRLGEKRPSQRHFQLPEAQRPCWGLDSLARGAILQRTNNLLHRHMDALWLVSVRRLRVSKFCAAGLKRCWRAPAKFHLGPKHSIID